MAGDDSTKPKNLAQLVTRAMGQALLGWIASLVVAGALVPAFDEPERPPTPMQEFAPLAIALALWLIIVTVIVVRAVRYGRRLNITAHDFRHIELADFALCAVALGVSLFLGREVGAVIATSILAILFVFSLMYLAIGIGIGVRMPGKAWVYPAVIVLFGVFVWL